MTLAQKIIETVSPIVPVCAPDIYETDAGEPVARYYCTFNFNEIPQGFGDDRAHTSRALVQVHYFAPKRVATLQTRHALRDALAAVEEFTAPSIDNASDAEGQHYVLEFDALGRWEDDHAAG